MIIPKIRFVNFLKKFPNSEPSSFSRWFYAETKWSGRIIHIGIKSFALILDFRKDWVSDFMEAKS